MTVAFATIHQTMRYRGEDTGLHVVAFDDGGVFFSFRQPRLYDAAARPIPPREILPGAYVMVRYAERQRRRLMDAIQLLKEPEEEPPFLPVLDDGHL